MKNLISSLLFVTLLCFGVDAHAQTTKKPKNKKQSTSQKKSKSTPAPTAPVQEPVEKPDLNVKPGALESTPFAFPKYEEFTMPSGLHVFVVENHELPTITFSILVKGGDAYDPPAKEGTAAITGDMMGKGTVNHTAAQTAELLDGVGATLSVRSSGEAITVSGASLTKHKDLLFSLLGEQLTTPAFPSEEIEKLRKQYLASVANQKSRAMETAQALSRKVIYGFDNPLARKQSEQSVKSVTKEDIVKFFDTYVKPNNSSIAIVGDVTVKQAKEILNKHLTTWTKGEVPTVVIPNIATQPQGVYFVPRPGSVQSSVIVCAPAPANKDEQFLALDITSAYFGSGFGSVLFNTLREKYSYTYSPFGFLTQGARYNRVAVGAEVRTSVTDSAIAVILKEAKRLGDEGPDEEALRRRVASEVGEYRLSFERAANVATYLQNAWFDGTPLEDVKRRAERIEAISYGDVVEAAKRYLGMFDLRIIVVGNPEIKDKLDKFGQVFEYTPDLTPSTTQVIEPVTMSVEDVVTAYANSIGGQQAISNVKSVSMQGKASMSMQGNEMNGTVVRKWMSPNMEFVDIDLKVMKQTQSTDGQQAWTSSNGAPAHETDAEETKKIIVEARMFPVLSWKADGYKCAVKGKSGGQIIVDATSPFGRQEQYFFDATTMLLTKVEKIETTPNGPVTVIEKYENYSDVSGVKFPMTVTTQNSIYSLMYTWEVSVNSGVDVSDFKPTSAK